MKATLWLLVALTLSACRPPLASAVGAAAAELDPAPQVVAAVALRADDAQRAAFAAGNPRRLESYFGGAALLGLRLQVAHLASRGLRRVEVLESRRVVHLGGVPGQPEVVLEIRARQQVSGSWSTVLRQWRAQLGRQGGSWLVMEAGDLPPMAWWR